MLCTAPEEIVNERTIYLSIKYVSLSFIYQYLLTEYRFLLHYKRTEGWFGVEC